MVVEFAALFLTGILAGEEFVIRVTAAALSH
jgi:hypothetical protein